MALLVSSGLADNSRKSYARAVSRFIQFCVRYELDPFRVNESTILRFIAHLSSDNIAPSTVRVYLAGIRAWLISEGIPTPLIYSQRVKWALMSLRRSAPPPARAPPFTMSMFLKVFKVILYSYDSAHLFSSMLLGYFGCLRASEYLPAPEHPPSFLPLLDSLDLRFLICWFQFRAPRLLHLALNSLLAVLVPTSVRFAGSSTASPFVNSPHLIPFFLWDLGPLFPGPLLRSLCSSPCVQLALNTPISPPTLLGRAPPLMRRVWGSRIHPSSSWEGGSPLPTGPTSGLTSPLRPLGQSSLYPSRATSNLSLHFAP